MKKIIPILLTLLMITGCTNKKDIPVTNIWDDVPEFTIRDSNIDLSQFSSLSSKKVAWGVGRDKDENNQPLDCVAANLVYGARGGVFVGEPTEEIYLTFDNGYENGNTVPILDTLKEKNVTAIFFLTSQYIKENPDLVQRMIDEGHIIGNHSYHHYSFAEITLEKVVEEIMSLHELMLDHFNYNMTYMRPPKGEFTEQVLGVANELGYKTLLWSYAYYDYNVNDQPSESVSLKKLLDNAHPGAIYLLHSVSDTNMNILGDLIDGLRELNYKVVNYTY